MQSLTAEEGREFASELAVVARRWRTRLDERLVDLKMSQSRWLALHWLRYLPEGVSQAALAERTAVEAPSLTKVIDQLEKLGVVERRPSPTDRRVNLVHLTQTAGPITDEIEAIAEHLREEVMGDISQEDFKTTLRVLKQLRARLEEVAD